jgi:hypothetical protein
MDSSCLFFFSSRALMMLTFDWWPMSHKFQRHFQSFFCFWWYWGLELRASHLLGRHSTTWSTLSALFSVGHFFRRVLWAICLGWFQTVIFLFCLPSSEDYRCELPGPGSSFLYIFYLKKIWLSYFKRFALRFINYSSAWVILLWRHTNVSFVSLIELFSLTILDDLFYGFSLLNLSFISWIVPLTS